MSLRSELGDENLGLAFLWLKDRAFSFAPDELMPDVEGEDWWQYMIMWTPWSEGNTYDLPDALSFALRLGDGQQHFGFVPAELLASHGPAVSSVCLLYTSPSPRD